MFSASPETRPSVTAACRKALHLSRIALVALLAGLVPRAEARGQTFVQLTDLGSNSGPRLTRVVTRQRLNRSLFGSIGTKVSFINQGTVYQFATDPEWSRILIGLWDQWIHEYDNRSGPGGRLLEPQGIDISARRYVYAADRAKGWILLAEFSPGAQNLVNPGVWASSQFPRPVDVAWDGRTTPLTVDFLYVVDDSLNRVSYWDRPTLLWSYGAPGSGVGQFSNPSGVCVGKSVGPSGGTQFTTYFYIVDRGNRRIVWLNRGTNGPSWLSTATLPDWDPTDCTVDHFGNLYVVDELGHRIHKFTYSLTLLASYGTFGKGATNYDTFAWPHAISVPCGLKVVNSQTVWYCEGRVITAEQWSDSSGAVEHYLNFQFALTAGPDTSTKVASIAYHTTDHTRQWVRVLDWNNAFVRTLANGTLMPPGTIGWLWNGLRDNGTWTSPGNYRFRIDVESAYGCGYSWCRTTRFTNTFWSNGNQDCGPDDPPLPAPIVRSERVAPQACIASDFQTEPATLFLQQRILVTPQSLHRLAGLSLSAPTEATTTGAGSLTELVRQHGVRGLLFGVTPAASSEPVTIRVYSLAGRLVRVLVNERLAAGFYELGWDGLDAQGRSPPPGVYVAVMTIGSFRGNQRLILRHAP